MFLYENSYSRRNKCAFSGRKKNQITLKQEILGDRRTLKEGRLKYTVTTQEMLCGFEKVMISIEILLSFAGKARTLRE